MSLKEELMQAARKYLGEGVNSSKEMIANNSIDCDQMGMTTNAPGEFSEDEITDRENLVNTGKLSNDNKTEEQDVEGMSIQVAATNLPNVDDIMHDLLNLSGDEHEEHEHHHPEHHSAFAARMESVLNGRSFAEILMESDFAGPTHFNPDHRIGSGEVLDAVKNAIEDKAISAKLSINVDVDENEIPIYRILNAEEKDLPATLEIDMKTAEPIKLKKDGTAYTIVK